MWVFDKKPDIVFPPQTSSACYIEDDKFYTTSLQKGRTSIVSIQRNLGFSGKLQKKEQETICGIKVQNYPNGLYVWTRDKKILAQKQLSKRIHPYCPAYLK
jgi:hypothetical protein